ncbi:Tafazzin [Aphelenchoides besseyi]|nr:Tafazzin [Aphelenchoides besseyi]KAI6202320.1 Tafazzin [Aphelenchoides besseyi]
MGGWSSPKDLPPSTSTISTTDPTKTTFKYPWPFPSKRSLIYEWKSKLTISLVYLTSKIAFQVMNKLTVENKETFMKAIEDRSRPLITVSNHRCNADDPLIWSMFTFPEFFRNISRFRYILAAHNICFTNPLYTTMFSLGRCIPCVRGEGIFQRGVNECIDVLSRNEWVHVFPEGKVTPEPIRIKWGVSRMITEAARPPVLLPIWLDGMADVLSSTKPYYLTYGNHVRIIVGKPYDTSLLRNEVAPLPEIQQRTQIANFVQDYLFTLGKQTAKNLKT